jgi:hypothetical protein
VILLVVLTNIRLPSFDLIVQRRGIVSVKLTDEAEQAAIFVLL